MEKLEKGNGLTLTYKQLSSGNFQVRFEVRKPGDSGYYGYTLVDKDLAKEELEGFLLEKLSGISSPAQYHQQKLFSLNSADNVKMWLFNLNTGD